MKNRITSDHNEFYVGYLPNAPRKIASAIKRIVFILFAIVIGVAAITALEQKKFSPVIFEYGLSSSAEGYLYTKPVPHLQVPLGKNISNKELYQTVLLVGFGKAGFIFSHDPLEKMEGAKVRVAGSLIYGHGKTLLQVEDTSNVEYLGGKLAATSIEAQSEKIMASGEIVDPKCFFGVMKPGEGKTHRSCAIRCIAGGIPPVFKTDSSGYFLLVNEKNEPVSTEIVNIVGDNIVLQGRATHLGDWTLLQIDSELIRKLSASKKWNEKAIVLDDGITYCR